LIITPIAARALDPKALAAIGVPSDDPSKAECHHFWQLINQPLSAKMAAADAFAIRAWVQACTYASFRFVRQADRWHWRFPASPDAFLQPWYGPLMEIELHKICCATKIEAFTNYQHWFLAMYWHEQHQAECGFH
jgi:hypothetical protein